MDTDGYPPSRKRELTAPEIFISNYESTDLEWDLPADHWIPMEFPDALTSYQHPHTQLTTNLTTISADTFMPPHWCKIFSYLDSIVGDAEFDQLLRESDNTLFRPQPSPNNSPSTSNTPPPTTNSDLSSSTSSPLMARGQPSIPSTTGLGDEKAVSAMPSPSAKAPLICSECLKVLLNSTY